MQPSRPGWHSGRSGQHPLQSYALPLTPGSIPATPPLPGLPAPAARDEDASFMQEVGLEVKLVDSLSQFRNLWK